MQTKLITHWRMEFAIGLIFAIGCVAVVAEADQTKPIGVDARARELFKNLVDRFQELDVLAVNATTMIETRESEQDPIVRQMLRQRLSFRRPDGFAIKRLTGSAPVAEVYYLKEKASMVVPGLGVIRRDNVASLQSFFRSRLFGYERTSKTNRIMEQNFAAIAVRDLLVRARGESWDEDVVGYEYIGQEGDGYGALHGIRITEKGSDGTLSANVWLTEGPRPRINRIEPDVEQLKKHLPDNFSYKMLAKFEAWDFSPNLDDDQFKAPPHTGKKFTSVKSALREQARNTSAETQLRERLIGKDVSDLTLDMIDGTAVALSEFADGEAVVLDFWASWCSPCLKAFAEWDQLLSDDRFASVKYVAVNQGEPVPVISSLRDQHDWDFSIAVDVKRQLGLKLEVHAIPQAIIVDSNGRIGSVVFGLNGNNRISVAAELEAVVGSTLTESQVVDRLRARQDRVKEVVKKVSPAVVGLFVGNGGGSGVIVNESGLILTAAHVTNRAGQRVQVMLENGQRVWATSLGADHRRDAAMIQINEDEEPDGESWPFAEISEKELKLGEWVVSMGHPGGYHRNRTAPVRVGRVIKLDNSKGVGKEFFATDCTITMGDSGGPAFDLDGRVIGIHSFISTRIEENLHVPVSAFRDGWDRMLAKGVWGRSLVADDGRDRAFFGVYLVPSDKDGAVIEEVVKDGPADKAGIQAQDRIIAFGDVTDIENRDQLRMEKAKHRAGETVAVVVMRGDERIETEVILGKVER